MVMDQEGQKEEGIGEIGGSIRVLTNVLFVVSLVIEGIGRFGQWRGLK